MKRNVLFCYSRIPTRNNAAWNYMSAFGKYSENLIHYYDLDNGEIDFDLKHFDSVVLCFCFRALPLSVRTVEKLRHFDGLKIVLFQDEYDHFLWHRDVITKLGIQVIFTCVPEAYWSKVFGPFASEGVVIKQALTGYVSDDLLGHADIVPMPDRNWWLGYRGRTHPFYYGALTQEKFIIGEKMRRICEEKKVPANIDVTEQSRIYGDDWLKFLGNCRAVLGTESGSNVFDFDGTLKVRVKEFLKANPEATFETVENLFLQGIDGEIKMNQISPRIFEAIAMKSVLVLFEGHYSGVINPWTHYIPLAKDFSNVDEVIAKLANTEELETLADRTYRDVIGSGKYHYETFICEVDKVVSENSPAPRGFRPAHRVLGWRGTELSKLETVDMDGMLTSVPLLFIDEITEPVFVLKFNGFVLRQKVIRSYEKILYSKFGKRFRVFLSKNKRGYYWLQKAARLATGRWSDVR